MVPTWSEFFWGFVRNWFSNNKHWSLLIDTYKNTKSYLFFCPCLLCNGKRLCYSLSPLLLCCYLSTTITLQLVFHDYFTTTYHRFYSYKNALIQMPYSQKVLQLYFIKFKEWLIHKSVLGACGGSILLERSITVLVMETHSDVWNP